MRLDAANNSPRPRTGRPLGLLGVGQVIVAILEQNDDEAFLEEGGAEFLHGEEGHEGVVSFFENAAAGGGEGVGGVVTDQKMLGMAGLELRGGVGGGGVVALETAVEFGDEFRLPPLGSSGKRKRGTA